MNRNMFLALVAILVVFPLVGCVEKVDDGEPPPEATRTIDDRISDVENELETLSGRVGAHDSQFVSISAALETVVTEDQLDAAIAEAMRKLAAADKSKFTTLTDEGGWTIVDTWMCDVEGVTGQRQCFRVRSEGGTELVFYCTEPALPAPPNGTSCVLVQGIWLMCGDGSQQLLKLKLYPATPIPDHTDVPATATSPPKPTAVPATATPKPTDVPATEVPPTDTPVPATEVPTKPSVGPSPSEACLQKIYAAETELGMPLTPIGTEWCAANRQEALKFSDVWCPDDVSYCTWTHADTGRTYVHKGGDGWKGDIYAGTLRWLEYDPAGDPGRCAYYLEEDDFLQYTRGVRAWPYGFTCPGEPAPDTCPTTSSEVATLVGGDASGWNALIGTHMRSWVYGGAEITVSVPSFGRIDYPGGASSTPGETVTSSFMTFHCDG